jgi:HKD family nuclease
VAAISLITPLDQPTGTRRLLTELKANLAAVLFDEFRMVVAFAKSGPLLRLRPALANWKNAGHKVRAIFGISMRGTSKQALSLALELFDETYVTREPRVTFHPKMYLFSGKEHFRCFVGSGNLTVGGTETNFEAFVQVDAELPEEEAVAKQFVDAWKALLPGKCPATQRLTADLITKWNDQELLFDEAAPRQNPGADRRADAAELASPRSLLAMKPPSALPPSLVKKAKKVTVKPAAAPAAHKPGAGAAQPKPSTSAAGVANALAIQIKPHHNGEIFLSVTAALQKPAFFGWPFQGKTIPKKANNPSYPQIDPDPIVNIAVYGAKPEPMLVKLEYALNTVYYEKKSEIRITASPLVGIVPDYSVMIMRQSDIVGIDYEMVIHRPDSPEYQTWLAACNQTMPGGGKKPRQFGWF